MRGYFTLQDTGCLIDSPSPVCYEYVNIGSYGSACEDLYMQIQKGLIKRNFEVPGVELEFYLDASNATVKIFKLNCDHLDVIIVSDHRINIPKMEVSIFNDGSGSLDVYALGDWGKDRKEFVYGTKFHCRMNNQSRLCLNYDLRYDKFCHTADSREYQPNGFSEPKCYDMHKIIGMVESHLIELLAYIESFEVPERKPISEIFAAPLPLPFAMYPGKLMTFDTGDFMPGWRLLGLGEKLPDHPLSSVMHDGFIYMEPFDEQMEPKFTNRWGSSSGLGNLRCAVVNLLCANDVYVVDVSHDTYDAVVSTLVRSSEYAGGYKSPVYLMNRRLKELEIEEVYEKV